jgi:glucose-1-phosphate adenylyltransferase
MSSSPTVQAFVMAGGAGTRLHPLTQGLCKPALPFAGNYCVVDFVLGNLWNSGVPRADVLVQHEPDALIERLRQAWAWPGGRAGRSARGPEFARVVRATAAQPFKGTADAVFQALQRLDPKVDLVLVFGADHVYRMDVRQMIDFHRAQHADVTVAALPVPLAHAGGFGIVDADAHGRVQGFQEKPRALRAMPGRPGMALASMGNYVFDAGVLRRELALAAARGETDFGQHVLPRLLHHHRVMAYDFATNAVPGLSAHEDRAYWRDVGTIDAYFQAHLDTLGEAPAFELDNPHWPVLAQPPAGRPPVVLRSALAASSIGAGAVVEGAAIERSVVGRGARVRDGAQLACCVLLDRVTVGAGAQLRNVIVDRDNVIPPGEVIGHDLARDRERFPVSAGGIVVVPRGSFGAAAGTVSSSSARGAGRGAVLLPS